jgi:hypothetical protein
MSGKRKVSDEEILAAVWDEVLKEDWLPGVLAAAAHSLGVAPSTITRRFQAGNGELRRALVDWALDPDGQPDNDWTKELAAETVAEMAKAPNVAQAFADVAYSNWEFVKSDERMFMQMLLWSRIDIDSHLRSRMKGHYSRYDHVHRVLWQDMLNHLRERTGKPVLQRRGLTEQQFIIILDAMVEGFVLRSAADPDLPIAELYAAAFQSLAAAALDFDGDLRTIEEVLLDEAERSSD